MLPCGSAEDSSAPWLQGPLSSLLAKPKCLGPGQQPGLCSFLTQTFLFPRLFLQFFTVLHLQEMSLNPSLKSNPKNLQWKHDLDAGNMTWHINPEGGECLC